MRICHSLLTVSRSPSPESLTLVHIRPNTVGIIDFKTDLSRHAQGEYRKQLSVYHHVLDEWFPDREVTAEIFYTAEGTRVDVEPFSRADLVEIVAEISTKGVN